jgi:hypothetical protein
LAVKTKKTQTSDDSTQRHLSFSQIKENIIIMKDSSARIVFKCSTINFLLKSTEEQDSIIMSFQRFLNSLNFPIQILVRSVRLDIDWYLWKLERKALEQKNSLLQNQTYEYIEYLKKLVEVAQIMRKDFYLVIPFDLNDNISVRDNTFFWSFKNFWSSIYNSNDIMKVRNQIKDFSKIKKWLVSRSGIIKTSLENIWIKTKVLEKADLVKLLTDYYNPNLESISPIKWDINDYNLI